MTILFAGMEDFDFTPINTTISAVANSASIGQIYVDTATNAFRSGQGRCALTILGPVSGVDTTHYMRNNPLFSASLFWTTFRCNTQWGNGPSGAAQIPVRFVDSSGVVRLRVAFASTASAPNDTFTVSKVNAAGTATQLGSASTGRWMSPGGGSYNSTADKIDIFVNYAVSGQFTVYLNGVQTYTFSGDLTTDGQTLLAGVDLGSAAGSPNSSNYRTAYSEVLVEDVDTRAHWLGYNISGAPGNTDNFSGQTLLTTRSFLTAVPNSSTPGTANQLNFGKWTAPNHGWVTSLGMSTTAGSTGTTQMAIYSDRGGAPGDLIATTGTVVNPVSGFTDYAFSTVVPVVSGTIYWVGYRSTGSFTFQYLNSGTNVEAAQSGQASFPPSASASIFSSVTLYQYVNLVQSGPSSMVTDDTKPDASNTAGQIQEYEITGSLPNGIYSIVGVVHKARMMRGGSGPSKMDFLIRLSGTDYPSSDISLSAAPATYQYVWATNPNTGLAWNQSDIAQGSTAYQIGYKSVT